MSSAEQDLGNNLVAGTEEDKQQQVDLYADASTEQEVTGADGPNEENKEVNLRDPEEGEHQKPVSDMKQEDSLANTGSFANTSFRIQRSRSFSNLKKNSTGKVLLSPQISLSILGRCLEPTRFTIPERYHQMQVSEKTFEEVLENHHRVMVEHRDILKSGKEITDPESPLYPHRLVQGNVQKLTAAALLSEDHDLVDMLADSRAIWPHTDPRAMDGMTFDDLLKFDLPDYPITTKAQREGLASLTKQTTVRRREVMQLLGIEKDHAIIDLVFGGGRTVPGQCLSQICLAMELHPKRLPFLTQCAHDIVASQRNMASFIPFFCVFIATLALVPNMGIREMFTMKRTAWWPTTDDWVNYCPNGPQAPCHMIKRNLPDMHTLYDAESYWHREMIDQLWGWAGAEDAAVEPWAGNWLIGGMLLRMSPMEDRTNTSVPVTSCRNLNLTQGFTEYLMPQSFQCSAWSHIVIPFSKTHSEARAMASQFRADILEPNSDSLAVIQYGMVRPTDGTLSWVTITATIPNGGNIISRSTVVAIPLDSQSNILPFLVMQAVLLTFNICVQLYYSSRHHTGIGKILYTTFTQFTSLLPPIIQTCLLIGAYTTCGDVQLENLAQTEFVVDGFDRLAVDNSTGMDLFAAWLFVYFALSVRYLKDVVSVGLVIRLLKVALAEVLGLLVVFGFTYLMFLMAAMVLMGSTEVLYSSAFAANSKLLPFFWGEADYEAMIEENPFLGGIFFYAFQIFVVFFALNLLIAVVTAPLGEVREAANLHLELYEAMHRPMSKAPRLVKFEFGLRKALLPLVSIIADTFIFFPVTDRWVTFSILASQLYHYDPTQVKTLKQALSAARQMNDFCVNGEEARHYSPWDTTLLQGCEEFECIPDAISKEFLILCNCYASENSWIRDGRLLRMLISFDQMNTVMEKIVTESADLRQQNAEKEDSIVAMQDSGDLLAETAKARTSGGIKSEAKRKMTERLQAMRGKMKARKDVDLKFAFSHFLRRKLSKRRYFPLYYLVMLVAYVAFVAPIISSRHGIAWLNENVHGGVRDFPYVTNCNDAQCTGGFMHHKTLKDTGTLGDVYQFVDSILDARLMPASVPFYNPTVDDPVEEDEHLVYWDRYVRRDGPILMRQLRGIKKDCVFPAGVNGDAKRRKIMMDTPCYGGNEELTKEALPIPAAAASLAPSAFEYQSDCFEVGHQSVRGYLGTYPCEGYLANISTKTQLAASKVWIDNSTRLVVVTLNFRLDVIKFQYNVYFELGNGGGTVFVWTRSTPKVEQALAKRNWIVYVLMGWDLLVWLYAVGRVVYFRTISGDLLKAEHINPEFPTCAFFCFLAGLLVVFGTRVDQPFIQDSLLTVLCCFYMTVKFLLVVVFPTAELFTRRASTVLRVLSLTAKTAVIVVPFYVVYFIAFVYYGHVVFGQVSLQFATFGNAMQTIGRGITFVWDIGELYEEKPIGALIITFLFFVIVLTILANLILSLITGAADEARAEMASMDYIAHTTNFLHYPLYSGPLFECWLYWTINTEFWKNRGEPQRIPFAITTLGRFGLPTETLSWLPFLGCTLTGEVLDMLDFRHLPQNLVSSTVMYVAKEVRAFEHKHRERSLDDEALEKVLRLQSLEGDDAAGDTELHSAPLLSAGAESTG